MNAMSVKPAMLTSPRICEAFTLAKSSLDRKRAVIPS